MNCANRLVLLHADFNRLRLLANLVAELRVWQVSSILVLGFTESVCKAWRGVTTCAHSSYLRTGPLVPFVAARGLSANYVAWLQRFYYLRRFLELRVSVLALDTDITVHAEPFAVLRPFGERFALTTTFDFKARHTAPAAPAHAPTHASARAQGPARA